jgi:hypothetical protein
MLETPERAACGRKMTDAAADRRSTKTLVLWLIAATAALYLALNTGGIRADQNEPVPSAPLLPAMFPDTILAFDPLEAVMQSQSSVAQCVDADRVIPTDTAETDDLLPGMADEDPFHPIITDAARRYDVDTAMVKAIIFAESSYNPRAVSRRGAAGLMQLMPTTARELGVKDRFDPEQNIHGGVKYFRHLLNRYKGSVQLALAAYNAGTTKVRKYRGIPPFKATRHYIDKVLNYRRHYSRRTAEKPPPSAAPSCAYLFYKENWSTKF